jgi:hypothetical protein
MSEGETTTPKNETTETPGTPPAQTGDIINPPKTEKDFKKVKRLGWFLVIIPLITVFLIIVLWPNPVASSTPGDIQEKEITRPQQGQETPNTTGKTQTGEPKQEGNPGGKVKWSEKVNIFGFGIPIQLRIILLVLLGGALGSYIHMATSYSYYIGFNKFDMDFLWWYLLRIPIGAVLALIFLTLIQGGMFTASGTGSETQPVTLIGLSALVGMFSRQATEKLKEVFDIVFKTRESQKNENLQDQKNKITREQG